MPFNGAGVFNRLRQWTADAAAGIKIRADFHDSEDDNFATGLTNCITKDGQTLVTQNIPMNNKRITGLADPIDPQDAMTKGSVTTTVGAYLPLTGGAITGNLSVSGTLTTGNVYFAVTYPSLPTVNGQMTFEPVSNTQMRLRYKGSDGVNRSAILNLSIEV